MKVCDGLRQEVSDLNKSLKEERTNAICLRGEASFLTEELEKKNTQWQRQKTLKEMYINRGKETKRELESLQKYSDPETLSTAKIAAQVRNHIKQKKKKDLQKDYEELQVAYMISQEKFTAELQVEREKNKRLQENLERITASHGDISSRYETDVINVRKQCDTLLSELEREIQQRRDLQKDYDELQVTLGRERSTTELQGESEKNKLLHEDLERMKVSHREISNKYETDVVVVRQQAESLQCQLDKEVKNHTATVAEGWKVINGLKAELEACHHKMAEEMRIQQQDAAEKDRVLRQELEDLKTQLNTEISRNLELSKELKAEKEDYRPPRKRARREETREDEQLQQLQHSFSNILAIQPLTNHQESSSVQQIIPVAPVPELPEEAVVSVEMLPETTKTPSIWTRTRHFLGLRKPQRWKN